MSAHIATEYRVQVQFDWQQGKSWVDSTSFTSRKRAIAHQNEKLLTGEYRAVRVLRCELYTTD